MAQISRPFQIALVAVVLLAGVWLFVLHGGSSNSNSPSSVATSPVVTSSVSPSSTPATHAGSKAPAAKASAPAASPDAGANGSLGGLSHAIAKAHEAVGDSEHNANQLEHKSQEASNETAPSQSSPASSRPATPSASTHSTPAAPSTTTAHTPAAAGTSSSSTAAATTSTARTGSTAHGSASTAAALTGQHEVEAELAEGKIVVLLFWNPAGADDTVVHDELQLLLKAHTVASKAKTEAFRHAEKFLGLELDKKIAVHEALAGQVASYGSITRGVQIYGTPTLLVINPHGQAITLTGITDAYSIEQAIEEARAA
jgi:hypothetical protein